MLPKEIHDLLEQASQLGNHYQKYINNVEKFLPDLLIKTEKAGLTNRIKIKSLSTNFQQDMSTLLSLSNDSHNALNNLGCYYSLQFLWFNILNLDWLDYRLTYRKIRKSTYKNFILRSGYQLRQLSAAYMHHLLEIFLRDKQIPSFVITGVGTRSDQDDIDVGIIDDGKRGRSWLNQMIHKMGVEMMRFATNLHFHLSEHVGHQAYSASIVEYQDLLKEKIGNFVILTEMIGSAYILGNELLFTEFQRKVTDKYYYRERANRYHEGYLRGIMGEIIDLTSAPYDPNYIHPKHDGLRIIKNLIYAYKVRLNIKEVNPWQILDVIRRTYPLFKREFAILEKSLSFLEIFRYIYQQLVVQEELISTTDNLIKDNLQQVALKLHFKNIGPHLARYQLLQEYTKSIQAFRKILPVFLEDLQAHLSKITVFRKTLNPKSKGNGNLKSLISDLDFFQSVHFWDDYFDLMQERMHRYKGDLFVDLEKMSPDDRFKCMKNLIDWSGNHPEFVFNFCLTLHQLNEMENISHLNNLTKYYINHYKEDPDFLQNLISLFQKKPTLICKIMQACSATTLENLNQIIFQKTIRGKRSVYQKNLAELIGLITSCSYYFKRFITNIYTKFPEYACYIGDPILFQIEETRILKHLPFIKSFDEKKRQLGHYYDLNFLGLGLETFHGLEVKEINERFTHFVNRYIQNLFQICLREVIQNTREASRISKHLVIYACGGNGREQAFDDDFDLIIVIDDHACQNLASMREIIALMNSEMIKRGTLPHFRFSHHFGEYFCPFEKLKKLVSSDYPENYIDQSQLLESRPLVGGNGIHEKFLKEIIKGEIFSHGHEYINHMIREINQRHGSTTFFREKCANIKECTGGLRDIEMIILIFKVLYQLAETDPYVLLKKFIVRNRKYASQWKSINNSLLFLQRFRYIYRLSITAEDHIYAEDLDDVAQRLNPEIPAKENPTEWLWNQFIFHRQESWKAVRYLIRALD
jgi:hypothetical protein